MATPKSMIRATPSAPTMTLCGDTSRCTRPSRPPFLSRASWAPCNPASTPQITAAAMPTGTGSCAASAAPSSAESDCPRTYSMTMKTSAPSATMSSVSTTFG
ncbi:MAG: hypothetical protein WKG00_10230 [Polyangiaceae bacterium]